MDIFRLLGVAIITYLIGSILTGAIIGRLKQVNLRKEGSGNVGATNAFRSMGAILGAIVLLGDVLKGVIAVWIGRWFGTACGIDLATIAALFVVVGHNWSVFGGFKGGKGIATSLGVIIALTPLCILPVVATFVIVLLLSGFVSLGSICAAMVYAISAYIYYGSRIDLVILTLFISALAIYRHHANIGRLIRGEENRVLYKNRGKKS